MIPRLALLLVIAALDASRAHADPILGVRGGFAEQVHYGGPTYFEGSGVMLAVEGGARLWPGLGVLVAIERGPQLSTREMISYPRSPKAITLRDLSVLAIVEGERGGFVFGGGAGFVIETITSVYWGEDGLGPTEPYFPVESRTGGIAVARGGIRMTSDGPSVLVVGQVSAQRINEQNSRAYGASIGMAVRWR